jgi:hypothetical protein
VPFLVLLFFKNFSKSVSGTADFQDLSGLEISGLALFEN